MLSGLTSQLGGLMGKKAPPEEQAVAAGGESNDAAAAGGDSSSPSAGGADATTASSTASSVLNTRYTWLNYSFVDASPSPHFMYFLQKKTSAFSR